MGRKRQIGIDNTKGLGYHALLTTLWCLNKIEEKHGDVNRVRYSTLVSIFKERFGIKAGKLSEDYFCELFDLPKAPTQEQTCAMAIKAANRNNSLTIHKNREKQEQEKRIKEAREAHVSKMNELLAGVAVLQARIDEFNKMLGKK